jgi:hypothetical protein
MRLPSYNYRTTSKCQATIDSKYKHITKFLLFCFTLSALRATVCPAQCSTLATHSLGSELIPYKLQNSNTSRKQSSPLCVVHLPAIWPPTAATESASPHLLQQRRERERETNSNGLLQVGYSEQGLFGRDSVIETVQGHRHRVHRIRADCKQTKQQTV